MHDRQCSRARTEHHRSKRRFIAVQKLLGICTLWGLTKGSPMNGQKMLKLALFAYKLPKEFYRAPDPNFGPPGGVGYLGLFARLRGPVATQWFHAGRVSAVNGVFAVVIDGRDVHMFTCVSIGCCLHGACLDIGRVSTLNCLVFSFVCLVCLGTMTCRILHRSVSV